MTQNDQNNLCTHYMQTYPDEITKATKKEKKQF